MDEIKLPISLEYTPGNLQDLKADIDKTFADVRRYEKSWSRSKKLQFKLEGVDDAELNIENLVKKVGLLQQEFRRVENATPANRLLETTKRITDLARQNSVLNKRQVSTLREIDEYTEKQERAKKEIAKIDKELISSQKKYAAETAKVDSSEKGSSAKLKTLKAEFEQQQANLNARKQELTSEMAINQAAENVARERYETTRRTISSNAEGLTQARQEKTELQEVLGSEEALEAEENKRLQILQSINEQIKTTKDLAIEAQKAVSDAVSSDRADTGKQYGPYDSSSARTKALEAEAKRQEQAKAQAQKEAQKEVNTALKNTISGLKQERAAIQQSTSQYYYKLRAIKMLAYQVQALNNVLNNFGKNAVSVASSALSGFLKLTNPITAMVSPLKKLTSSMQKFATASKRATKNHESFTKSIKSGIKMFLQYALGIRSVYVLFNKLRSAMVAGMENLAQAFDPVNAKMSSIVTSLLQMKNAVAAAVEPMLNVLAPALAQIAELVSDIAVKVASFVATLTGSTTYVYKAVRAQVDYAESLSETKKQLSGLDKLNVINSDSKDDGMPDASEMFEKVPIDAEAAKMAEAFKDAMERLFDPIKKAWEEMSEFVIDSWEYAFEQIKDLWASIARDFWRVWEEEATQQIFENIFKIVGDIGLIVGNLARNLKTAWDINENGYRILAAIRDIILEISNDLVDLFDYMVGWSDKLSFIQLFNDLANVLESQVVPAVDKVGDLLVTLTEDIILEGIRYLIEQLIPQAIRVIGNLIEAIGNIAENFNNAWNEGEKGKAIIQDIETLINIVADGIEDCSEKTAEWASQLNFNPLLTSVKNNLEAIQPLIQFITNTFSAFYQKVLLPFWQYIIEDGLPSLLDTLSQIVGTVDWDSLTAKVNEFLEALEPFLEKVWQALVIILEDLGTALSNFLNSDALNSIIDTLIRWMDEADPEEMASKIETLVGAFIGLKAAIALLSTVLPIITGVMTAINAIQMGTMVSQVKNISAGITELQTILNGGELATAASATGPIALLKDQFTALFELITNPTGPTALATFGTNISNLVVTIQPVLSVLGTLAGALATVGGAIGSVTTFASMLADGWNVASAATLVFYGALTGLGLLLLGFPATVAAAVAGIIAIGANVIAWLATYGSELQGWWDGFISDVGEFFNNLGENLGKWIGELIVNIITWIGELPGKIIEWCANVDWLEVGLNIINGILFIFTLPEKLYELIMTAIANFVVGFIKGLCEAFGISSPAEKMKPYGEYIVNGILEGITNVVATIASWIDTNLWQPFKSAIDGKFNINSLVQIGKDVMDGLWNGLKDKWESVKSWLGDCWSSVKSAAKEAFGIGSPSKVFREYGDFIMEGLQIGLDEVDPVGDTFTDMIPEESSIDTFTEDTVSKLSDLKTNAITIIQSMVEEINAQMETLSFISDISNISASLSNMKIPDVVTGMTLPSNIEFTSSDTEVDLSKLPELMKQAFLDAINESGVLQNGDGDTIIEISGREVFRAVKDQNSQYKKQTGVSAFA